MKLRIFVGESNIGEFAEVGRLKTLYRSANLIIQGSDDVNTIALADGRQAFLVGNLIGIRSSQGEIVPCACTDANLEALIRNNSIEKCQEMLEGRYLLVVVGEDMCSICADRYGRYDLYYQTIGGTNVFASDLLLLPISPAQNGFDQMALVHSLTVYGFRPPKRHTFYQGIRRLGVREIVQINRGQVKFFEVPFQPLHTVEYGERELNQYADLMLDAVRIRASRYGNIVYLSSGWDSTSILACLVHIFGARKVRAVIVRILSSERSGVMNHFEIERAQAIADYYGVRLDIIDLDQRYQVPLEIEKYRPALKLHNIVSMTSLTHGLLADFVTRTTNGAEAVFAGEISDGAFNLGFSQFTTIFHPVLSFREYSDKMASYLFSPTFLGLLQNGQFLDDPVYKLLCGRVTKAVFDEPANGAPKNRTLQLLSSFFLRSNRLPLWSLRNNKILTEKGAAQYSEEMESIYLSQAAEHASPDTLYAWYLHLYNSFHWQSSTVSTLPITAQANGFHLALPFWDSRIQEFLSAMPEAWGRSLDLNPTKYPLKWMLRKRIDYPMHLQVGPHSYQYDVDPSVTPTGELMYASAFTPYFKNLLQVGSYRNVLSPEMFDLAYIDGLVNRYVEGNEISGTEFNDLVSICLHSMMGWDEN